MKATLPDLRRLLASDFRVFVDYFVQAEGYQPPPNQLRMATLLQAGHDRVAVFAARGFAKSYTAIVLYSAWRLLRNPHLKLLFLSGSLDRATKNAKALRDLLDEHPVFAHIKPPKAAPKTQFNLTGARREQSAFSVDAASVDTRRTGLHVDLILADDVEQDGDKGSLVRRDHLLDRLQEVEAWLNEPASRWFYEGDVPTPERTRLVVAGTFNCGRDSVYLEPEEDGPHWLRGAQRLVIPALDDAGESAFPSISSTGELLRKKATIRSDEWANQYLMDPYSIDAELCPFRVEVIERFSKAMPEAPLSAVVDWSEGGDYFAVALMGPWRGVIYLDDLLGWQGYTTAESFARLVPILAERGVNTLYLEASKTDPDKPDALTSVARRAILDAGARIMVEPFRTTRKKLDKILDLEPVLHTGALIVGPRALGHKQFMRELRGTRFHDLPRPHDDHLDAVASGVALFGDRITGSASDRPYGVTPYTIG